MELRDEELGYLLKKPTDSLNDVNEAINYQDTERIISVAFLRTQEITIRMIIVAITGCVLIAVIPSMPYSAWVGLLLAIYFTQNALGVSLMNAWGTLLGGVLGCYVTTFVARLGIFNAHWSIPCLFMISLAGFVGWTNYNGVAKKMFLLFSLLILDRNYAMVISRTGNLALNQSHVDYTSTMMAADFSLTIIFCSGLTCLGALLPWRRFARNELENEIRVILRLILKVFRLYQVLLLRVNQIKQQDRAFEYRSITSIIEDTLGESERQMLKAYHRIRNQMHWETIASLEYYTSFYYKVNVMLMCTHFLNYWLDKMNKHDNYDRKFLAQANRCIEAIKPLLESQVFNIFDYIDSDHHALDKEVEKFVAFMKNFEQSLNPKPAAPNFSAVRSMGSLHPLNNFSSSHSPMSSPRPSLDGSASQRTSFDNGHSDSEKNDLLNEFAQLYFGFGLIEIYRSIIEIKKLNGSNKDHNSLFEYSPYSIYSFVRAKVVSWFRSIHTEVVPWTDATPKIHDYLTSNAGKARLMMVFGMIFTQTICCIVLFNPYTRSFSPHIVWFPIMSVLNLNNSTVSTLNKSRARILGTTVGVVSGYLYLVSGIHSRFLLTVLLGVAIFLSGLIAVQNDEFCRQTVSSFMVIAFNFNLSLFETIELFSMHRYVWVVSGVTLNLLWYFIYWFNSQRVVWNQSLVSVIEAFEKLTKAGFFNLFDFELYTSENDFKVFEYDEYGIPKADKRDKMAQEGLLNDSVLSERKTNKYSQSLIQDISSEEEVEVLMRDDDVAKFILTTDDKTSMAELINIDSKVKLLMLATLQIVDDPRLWSPKSFDNSHLEVRFSFLALIRQVQRLGRATYWFSKYSQIKITNKERQFLEPFQAKFKKHFAKIERSFQAMKIMFSSSSILTSSGLTFGDFQSFSTSQKFKTMLKDIVKQNRLSTTLSTTLVVYGTMIVRMNELWELIFNIAIFARLQMMDDSADVF